MKVKKLICPKCGNIKEFRVDVQLTLVSTLLSFHNDEAELDTEFPNDVDIMCSICNVCGWELDYAFSTYDWEQHATKYTMCYSCRCYMVDADVAETCPHKKAYPHCFRWEKREAELEI